jgi:hypothetical protein
MRRHCGRTPRRVRGCAGLIGILRLRFRPLIADENFAQDDKSKIRRLRADTPGPPDSRGRLSLHERRRGQKQIPPCTHLALLGSCVVGMTSWSGRRMRYDWKSYPSRLLPVRNKTGGQTSGLGCPREVHRSFSRAKNARLQDDNRKSPVWPQKAGMEWATRRGDTLNDEKRIPPVSLRSRVGMTSGGAGILRLRFRPLIADENFAQDDIAWDGVGEGKTTQGPSTAQAGSLRSPTCFARDDKSRGEPKFFQSPSLRTTMHGMEWAKEEQPEILRLRTPVRFALRRAPLRMTIRESTERVFNSPITKFLNYSIA